MIDRPTHLCLMFIVKETVLSKFLCKLSLGLTLNFYIKYD